jgi:hypothetical protein
MTLEIFDSKAGLDRFATNDEIRAALSSLPGFFVECDKDSLWEVESDLGGTVLVETEGEEILSLLEKLDTTAH